eukprot:1772701-Prymnesium_polylepis.1
MITASFSCNLTKTEEHLCELHAKWYWVKPTETKGATLWWVYGQKYRRDQGHLSPRHARTPHQNNSIPAPARAFAKSGKGALPVHVDQYQIAPIAYTELDDSSRVFNAAFRCRLQHLDARSPWSNWWRRLPHWLRLLWALGAKGEILCANDKNEE